MDAFSYLSVLLSIVLGLAVTQLLSGFAALVHARRRVAMYWPVPLQMGVALLVAVEVWWSMFGMREVRNWTFGGFLVLLAQSIAVYLMAAFITPEIAGEERLDLREAYFREARWFFGSSLGLIAISLVKNLALAGHFQSGLDLVGHVAFATLSWVGFFSRSDRIHQLLPPLTILVLATYIGVLFFKLMG